MSNPNKKEIPRCSNCGEKETRHDMNNDLCAICSNPFIPNTEKEEQSWDCFDELNKKIFEICNRPMMGKWSVMQSCYDVKELLKQTEEKERQRIIKEIEEIATINRDNYTGEKKTINESVLLFLEDYKSIISPSEQDKEVG